MIPEIVIVLFIITLVALVSGEIVTYRERKREANYRADFVKRQVRK